MRVSGHSVQDVNSTQGNGGGQSLTPLASDPPPAEGKRREICERLAIMSLWRIA